jgi:hypothetical protein
MPRYPEMPEQMTPFAKVLVDYMWNRRPPMTTHQLAIKLGVPKQSTSNWVMRNVVPPFETIMAILAKLDIPMSVLYDAYKSAGILMPRWDAQDTDSPADRGKLPPTPRTRKATAVPVELDNNGTNNGTNNPGGYEPIPYTPPAPPADESEDWDALVEQTERLLREEGASDTLIAAVVSTIRSRQSGEQTPIQRALIAEHSEPTELSTEPSTEPSGEQKTKHTRQISPTKR